MDFELTEDQEALRDAVRGLCRSRFPMERVREVEETARVDRAGWRQLAETGVFGLRLPEEDGGAGLGAAEAVLVFEELGRALVPGPLVATHLAAGAVEGAATGERIVGLVERGRTPALVEHPASLDTLLVLDPDGVFEVDPAALDAAPVAHPSDPLTPVALVGELPAGERVAGPDVARRWRAEGGALVAALQLGIAGETTDLANGFAKERHQFGRPIGSFQAVKHILAEMLVRAEVARAAVYAAGVCVDLPEVGDPERAVAAARVVAGDAAGRNGEDCIQVHGGMGFTWEVDAHLFLKRAWVLDTTLGSPDEHAEAVAAHL